MAHSTIEQTGEETGQVLACPVSCTLLLFLHQTQQVQEKSVYHYRISTIKQIYTFNQWLAIDYMYKCISSVH